MQISNNTILITGGGTGIGLDLAVQFLDKGNEVIICGRRENALNEAKARYPKLHIRQAEISNIEGRKNLTNWSIQNLPKLNMLVNNAIIQREFLMDDKNVAKKFATENEIEINLRAPIHLTMLSTKFSNHKYISGNCIRSHFNYATLLCDKIGFAIIYKIVALPIA